MHKKRHPASEELSGSSRGGQLSCPKPHTDIAVLPQSLQEGKTRRRDGGDEPQICSRASEFSHIPIPLNSVPKVRREAFYSLGPVRHNSRWQTFGNSGCYSDATVFPFIYHPEEGNIYQTIRAVVSFTRGYIDSSSQIR